jgi:hypothetical protein
MRSYENGPGNIQRLPERVVDSLIDAAGVSRCAPGRTAITVRDQTANVEQLVHDTCEELLARLPSAQKATTEASTVIYTVNGEVMTPLEYIDYLHYQFAGEKLRADQGWERAKAKAKECMGLRERMANAGLSNDCARLPPHQQCLHCSIGRSDVCINKQGAAQPAHETIVSEGGRLVCTACGTSSESGAPDAPKLPTNNEVYAEVQRLRGDRQPYVSTNAVNDTMQAVRSLIATPAAPHAPVGYKLVPLEPTKEMLDAVRRPYVSERQWKAGVMKRHAVNYARMIAAAPVTRQTDVPEPISPPLIYPYDKANTASASAKESNLEGNQTASLQRPICLGMDCVCNGSCPELKEESRNV